VLFWATSVIVLYFAVFWFLVFLEHRESMLSRPRRRPLAATPAVTVVIPAYNEEETIAGSMRSVLALDYPADKLELLVFDDHSTDRTSAIARAVAAEHPGRRIRIIRNPRNLGKARSLNRGLQLARGEFFACLDADSLVDRQTLRKQLALYESSGDPDLAIVTPAMRVHPARTLAQKFQRLEYLIFLFAARMMSHLDAIAVAPGPFSLYRTAIIRKLGGFDTDNPTEDMEIAFRVQAHNYRIRQCPDAHVSTIPPATFGGVIRQRRQRWYRGSIWNALKYRRVLLSRRFGEFGIIHGLSTFAHFFLAFATLALAGRAVLKPLGRWIRDLVLVRFDLFTFIRNIEWNPSLLNVDLTRLTVGLVILGFSLLWIILAHRNTREGLFASGWLFFIPYFLFYYLLISVATALALLDYLRGRAWKW
jgi:cellulose synthase/poly-beta-1,6-N-acetylglucosamine synthase-like glycosyltransferase